MKKPKLTKGQKEVLLRMRDGNRDTIYIGMLGVEGLATFGMTVAMRIRAGTANAFIREGLAEKIENCRRVKLTEYGKTCEL